MGELAKQGNGDVESGSGGGEEPTVRSVRLDSLGDSRQVFGVFTKKELLMSKLLPKIIDPVSVDGVFRPTRKVALPGRSRVRLSLVPLQARGAKERNLVVARQRKALLGIAGIGASGQADISENSHRALYAASRAR